MSLRAGALTGTRICCPSYTIDPLGVPKAMVETGTSASDAAATARALGRPVVVSPSDISTRRAGGGS